MRLCGVRSCQCIAYAFNVLYVIFGLVILGIGLWAKLSISDMEYIIGDRIVHTAAILMIIAGSAVIVLAVFGCFGIYRKHKTVVSLYGLAILVVFIIELCGGVYVYSRRKEFRRRLAEGIRLTVFTRYGEMTVASKSATLAMDWVQKSVKCCGSEGPLDWDESKWYKQYKHTSSKVLVPVSCCSTTTADCNKGDKISDLVARKSINAHGCFHPSQLYVKKYYKIVSRVGMTIASLQLIGIIIFYVLAKIIKSENKTRRDLVTPEDTRMLRSTSKGHLK